MSHYESNPAEFESYVWRERSTIAARAWDVETTASYRGRLFGYGLGGAAFGFGATLGLLALMGWTWRFLLARIRELSDAFRGK